jgi:GNAT superfamily N-acetyltransferase
VTPGRSPTRPPEPPGDPRLSPAAAPAGDSVAAAPATAGAARDAPPLPGGLQARPPAPADGDALRALVAACDRSYLDWAPAGWTPPAITTDWSTRRGEPGRWSLCAFAGDDLVAYASFRPARHEPAPGAASGPPLPGLAHVAALYVHPARWRQGVGTAMLARAEAAMRSRGSGAARLWTPEGAPAERFYAAHGWQRGSEAQWHAVVRLPSVEYTIGL